MSRHAPLPCVLFLTPLLAAAQALPQPTPPSEIQIKVVQGDGAINSIRLHRGHDPVAQVLDATGEPVAGATVSFLLPGSGPSGTFQSSGLSYTTQTDVKGMAAAHGMTPNATPGQFHIRIAATWRGHAASATLMQTNAEPVVSSGRGKKIAIIALIAAGIAGGAAAALGHGGSSSQSPSGGSTGAVSGGTIVAGAPSIGPPH